MQSSPSPSRFDADRFQRLLALIGPAQTAAFLAQLTKDLSDCAGAIADGAARKNWTALREASHVLISLAGSVGAMSLFALAEALNKAAGSHDATALGRLLPDVQDDLSALLRYLRTTPADPGGPA